MADIEVVLNSDNQLENGIKLKTENTYCSSNINVKVNQSLLPIGTGRIQQNGTFFVKRWEYAEVDVPIPEGYVKPEGTLDITENGDGIDVTNYKNVNVNVVQNVKIQPMATVYPDRFDTFVEPATGYDALESVLVKGIPSDYVIPEGDIAITQNGDNINVAGYKTATVKVTPTLQEKNVTPTKSAQIVQPDGNYDGLSQVVVNAIPTDYIKPTGTKTINTNGEFDVSSFAKAKINVPTSGGIPTYISKEQELTNTPIPNSGTFSSMSFRFNTNLSIEETVELINNNVTFVSADEENKEFAYFIGAGSTTSTNPTTFEDIDAALIIIKSGDALAIMGESRSTIITFFDNENGWSTNSFYFPYQITLVPQVTLPLDTGDVFFNIGQDNDAISSLISLDNSVSDIYFGTEIKEGYIEKAYINTNLSTGEVLNIVSNPLIDYGAGSLFGSFILVGESEYGKMLLWKLWDSSDDEVAYIIVFIPTDPEVSSLVLWVWANFANDGTLGYGWQENAFDILPIYTTIKVGKYNSALTSLFSSTPFVTELNLQGKFFGEEIICEENKVIFNIKDYVDLQKIPSKITVSIPLDIYSIKLQGEIPTYAYSDSFYKEINIGSSVTGIGSYAFSNCPNLNKISIPNSVLKIGSYAFNGSPIYEIKIGSELNTIEPYAFVGVDNYCQYIIDASNNYFKNTSYNDIVSKDGSVLIRKAYDGDSESFGDAWDIIGEGAFMNLPFTYLHINRPIKEIKEQAFAYCEKLTNIDVWGLMTMAEFKAIPKGKNWNLGVNPSCEIWCTDGYLDINLNEI